MNETERPDFSTLADDEQGPLDFSAWAMPESEVPVGPSPEKGATPVPDAVPDGALAPAPELDAFDAAFARMAEEEKKKVNFDAVWDNFGRAATDMVRKAGDVLKMEEGNPIYDYGVKPLVEGGRIGLDPKINPVVGGALEAYKAAPRGLFGGLSSMGSGVAQMADPAPAAGRLKETAQSGVTQVAPLATLPQLLRDFTIARFGGPVKERAEDVSETLHRATLSQALKARVQTLNDIKEETWFRDSVDYIIGGTFEGLGSSLPIFAAGAAGGTPAVLAAGYTMSVGEIREELKEAGVHDDDLIRQYSYLAAIPHSLLDTMTERGLMKGMTRPAKQAITRGIVRALLTGSGKEGVTESLQRVIEIGAVAHALGGEAPNEAVIDAIFADVGKGIGSSILESGVRGAMPGTVFGGVEYASDVARVKDAIARGKGLGFGDPTKEARVRTRTSRPDVEPAVDLDQYAPPTEGISASEVPPEGSPPVSALDALPPEIAEYVRKTNPELARKFESRQEADANEKSGTEDKAAKTLETRRRNEAERLAKTYLGYANLGREKGDTRPNFEGAKRLIENAAAQSARRPLWADGAIAEVDRQKVEFESGQKTGAETGQAVETGAKQPDTQADTATLSDRDTVADDDIEAQVESDLPAIKSDIDQYVGENELGVTFDDDQVREIGRAIVRGTDVGTAVDAAMAKAALASEEAKQVAEALAGDAEARRVIEEASAIPEVRAAVEAIAQDPVVQETARQMSETDAYDRFLGALAGATPSKRWAKELGISPDEMKPLIAKAKRQGLIRQDRNGTIRRTAKAKEARPASQGERAAVERQTAAAKPFDPYDFSVRVSLVKEGRAGLTQRLSRLTPDQIRAIGKAQGLSGLAPAGADQPTLVDSAVEATIRRENHFRAAAGNAEGWKDTPRLAEVWGPKFQKLMSQQYQAAVAGEDYATQWDILSARYNNDPAIEPEMKAAIGSELTRLTGVMGDKPSWMSQESWDRFAQAPTALPPPPSLTIPSNVIFDRAVVTREAQTGRAMKQAVLDYATEIEQARTSGTDPQPILDRIASDRDMRKLEVHDLAHVAGYPSLVKVTTSKAAALATILKRHKDFQSARPTPALVEIAEKEAEYAEQQALRDAERGVSEESVSEGVRGDEEGRQPQGALDRDRAGGAGNVDLGARPDDEQPGSAGDLRGEGAADGSVAGDAAGSDQPRAPVRPAVDVEAVRAQVEADADREAKAREARTRDNYQITDEDAIGSGGPKVKVRANLAAIETLKKIEDENRRPTPEEKKTLVKYVGWGAFAQDVFSPYKDEWKKERAKLQNLLTPEEYERARASTLNAHYTSPDVIRGMWGALEHLGFTGGRALEPSAGIGHFIGMTPEALRSATDWTAVELDAISGRITKALYGATDVRVAGYETQKWPDGFFDLAISNVPFGDYKLTDPAYKPMLIHDYFFVKSLDKVRPGGIVAFITSSGTLDKKSQTARREMAKRATFLGAIRLPGGNKGAFKGNAGTDVTTDIIFLRKRVEGEPIGDQSWIDLKEIKTPEGPTEINAYFADNPDMMLGKMRLTGTMYRKDEPVLIGPTEGLAEKILEAARNMPEGAFLPASASAATFVQEVDTQTDGIKEGAFYEKDGTLYRKITGVGQPQKLNKSDTSRVRLFMGLRDIVNEMLEIQSGRRTAVDGRKESLRKALSDSYAEFVKAHGPINTTTITTSKRKDGKEITIRRMPNLAPLLDDPDVYKVSAIEVYDEKTGKAKKAAIFTEDILAPYVTPEIRGPADALAVSLNEKGKVDLPFIAERLGVSEAEAAAVLGDAIYRNPNGAQWQTAAQYLSGDVVTKLEAARTAVESDPAYARNVDALEKVQPEKLTRIDITVPFGAPWVPAEVYEAFVSSVIGGRRVKLALNEQTKQWRVLAGDFPMSSQTEFGTADAGTSRVLEAALNQQSIQITRTDDDGKTFRDIKAEEQANAKVQRIKEAFAGNPEVGQDGWVWADEARAQRLEAIYNTRFNRLVKEEHDGRHLTFPGLARTVTFPDGTTGTINLLPHRVNAVWRIIQNGNTLMDHAVGSGKTWTSIMAGMEMKRLGQIQRPMYVVPNHMLEQFATEFYQAYPNAKLLIATKESMSAAKRKEFAAKAAADKWDGIIITHSAFGRMSMSEAAYKDYYLEQIAAMEEAKERANREEGKGSPTVKDLEKAKKRLQTKLDKLIKKEKKDAGVTFEELGVDFLFVDEAHLFKNLWFPTMHTRVKGISNNSESQRATDLYIKIKHLERSRPGRSAVFMTGTPVSNTMAELYIMQKYLQGPVLEEYGIDNFDAWAHTFGQIRKQTELAPNGRDFRDTESFSRFVNIPELMALWAKVADTQTADMLKLPRPEMKGGKIRVVENDLSPNEETMIQSLIDEMEAMKGQKPEKGKPNFLSLFTRGIQLATDSRLVYPEAEFNPTGKIGKAVENITRIWTEGNADPNAPNKGQIVFLDMGVPGSKARKSTTDDGVTDAVMAPDIEDIRKKLGDDDAASADDASADLEAEAETLEAEAMLAGKFNLYQDLKDRLVANGIPAEQIAFIHDAKNDDQKAKLFAKVKKGEVRVLIGSTSKMGVGTNVQRLLVAMHHLDAPWKPADVEQRDGRILRQGNLNPEIEIYRYITKRSFDAYRWQILDRKSQFIGQIRAGAKGVRSADDIDPPLPEAAELKAAATGNPLIIEHAELTRKERELEVAKRAHLRSREYAEAYLGVYERDLDRIKKKLAIVEQDAAKVTDLSGDSFAVTLEISGGRQKVTERKKAGEAIKAHLNALASRSWYSNGIDTDLGEISGFRMGANVKRRSDGSSIVTYWIDGADRYEAGSGYEFMINEETDATQLAQRWVRLVGQVTAYKISMERDIARLESDIPKLREQAKGTPFVKEDQLTAVKQRLAEVTAALKPKAAPAAEDIPGTPENMAKREAAARARMAEPDYAAGGLSSGVDTSKVPGFKPTDANHEQWRKSRVYAVRDKQGNVVRVITGVDDAVKYLVDEAVAKAERSGGLEKGRKLYLLIGYGGAGKSTLADPLAAERKALHASADDAKLIIPEFNGGANAGGVHEESSFLGKEALKEFVRRGYNIVLEKLGSNELSITKPAIEMREEGYRTTLIHVDVPKVVAMERAIGRFKATGRSIGVETYDQLRAGEVFYTVKEEGAFDETAVFEWKEPQGWGWREVDAAGLQGLVITDKFSGAEIRLPGDGPVGVGTVDGSNRDQRPAAGVTGAARRENEEQRLTPPAGADPEAWLRDTLPRYGIDPEAFGKGQAKPFANLVKEVVSGETELVVSDGKLLRRVSALALDIFAEVDGKRVRLTEDRQEFSDGRVRRRSLDQSLGEKLEPGEDPAASIGRALDEELGIKTFEQIGGVERIDHPPMESPSYPGLLSQYTTHKAAVLIDASEYKPEYQEVQKDKTNYFVWQDVPASGKQSGQPATSGPETAKKIADLQQQVEKLKADLGVTTRTVSIQDASDVVLSFGNISTALVTLRQAVETMERGSRIAVITEHVAQFKADAEKVLAVGTAQAEIDLDDASVEDLQKFVTAVADLGQVLEAKLQAGYALAEDVQGLRDLLSDKLGEFQDALDEHSSMADDLLDRASTVQNEAVDRLDDLMSDAEREALDEIDTSPIDMDALNAETKEEVAAIGELVAGPDPSPDDSRLDNIGDQTKRAVALMPRLSEQVDALENEWNSADPEISREATEAIQKRAHRLTNTLSYAKDWYRQMSDLAYASSHEVYDIIDKISDEQVAPVVNDFENLRDDLSVRMNYAVELITNDKEMEAGQTIEALGKLYGVTLARALEKDWSEWLEKYGDSPALPAGKKEETQKDVAELRSALKAYDERGKASDPILMRLGSVPSLKADFVPHLPEVAQSLADQLRLWLPADVAIAIEDRILMRREDGRFNELNGFYYHARRLLKVALQYGPERAFATARHETIHALRMAGLFTEKEWSTLVNHAKKVQIGRQITVFDENGNEVNVLQDYRKLYERAGRNLGLEGDVLAAYVEELTNQELVAKLAETWEGGARYPSKIETLLARMRQFLEALRNALAGQGFTTPEQVFEGVFSGAVGRRSEIKPRFSVLPGGAKIMGIPLLAFGAYHGTPHTFAPEPGFPAGRFRLDKIGTGEGNQAYGHGLYFAESEGVARSYRDNLQSGAIEYTGANGWEPGLIGNSKILAASDHWSPLFATKKPQIPDREIEYLGALIAAKWDIEAAKKLLRDNGLFNEDRFQAVLNTYAPEEVTHVPGHMYQVRINAEPDQFLDWDLPLSQQSETIRKAMTRLANGEILSTYTGMDSLRSVAMQMGSPKFLEDPELSLRLREAGIPGLRYLDQGSRAAGDGSRNYVIFDDSLIEITHVDGVPVEQAGEQAPKGIRAYHGSPYEFDQLRGDDIYLAGDKAFAEHYKNFAATSLAEPPSWQEVMRQDTSGRKPGGRLYEAELNVSPDNMIVPGAAQQSPFVADVMTRLGVTPDEAGYRELMSRDGGRKALNDAGVRGAILDDPRAGPVYRLFGNDAVKHLWRDGVPVEQAGDPGIVFSLGNIVSSAAEQRRMYDALGFYSKLDEVLAGLKDTDTVTMETLAKRGVKAAEVEARGLSEILKSGAKVADIKARARPVEVREANYGLLDDRNAEIASIVENEDGSFWWAGQDYTSRRNAIRAIDENLRFDESGGRTKWSPYSLDPSNPTYRETVLHLPGRYGALNAFHAQMVEKYGGNLFDEMPLSQAERERLASIKAEIPVAPEFTAGHWSEPNVIAHARTSMVQTPEGKSVFHVDELQSDWGQKIRDGGARDEAKIAELKKRIDAANARYDVIYKEAATFAGVDPKAGYMRVTSSLRGNDGLPKQSAMPHVIALKEAQDEINLLGAEYTTLMAATPGHPLVNTTDQWVNTSFRRLLTQAVATGADYIAIPSGDTVHNYKMGTDAKLIRGVKSIEVLLKEDGTHHGLLVYGESSEPLVYDTGPEDFARNRIGDAWYEKARAAGPDGLHFDTPTTIGDDGTAYAYDQMYPKNVRNILSKLDPEAGKAMKVDKLKSPDGKAISRSQGHTLFPLTAKVKARIAAEGMPLFSLGDYRPGSDISPSARPRLGQLRPIPMASNTAYPDPGLTAPEKSLFDLVTDLTRTLGLTVRHGRLNPGLKAAAGRRGNVLAGQFDNRTGITRIALPNDLATLAHEGGHSLEVRPSTRAAVASLKAQFAEDLTVAPAPNLPPPTFPASGFTGLELDAETQRLIQVAAEADTNLQRMATTVGTAKAAGAPFDQALYTQLQELAGGTREALIRRIGQLRTDAAIQDLQTAAPADPAAHLAQRYSASGTPQPRAPLNPTPQQVSEGFAEYFRLYLTNPKAAQAESPALFRAFEDMLDGTEPAILEKLHAIQDGVDKLTQASAAGAVMSRVQSTVTPGLFARLRKEYEEKGSVGDMINDRLYTIYHAAVDARHPMKRAVRYLIQTAQENLAPTLGANQRITLKVLDDPYKLWRLAEHSKVHSTATLQEGVRLPGQIDATGPSFHDALIQAFGGKKRAQWTAENLRLFGSYLVTRRMLAEFERFDRGELEQIPDRLIDRADWQKSKDDFEAAHPAFEGAARTLYDFNRNMLRLKFEAGFITPELYQELLQRVDYVPVNRIMDDGAPSSLTSARGNNKRKTIFRFQGSTRDFINPLESIVQDVYATEARVALNGVIRAMDRLARAAGPGGGAIAERLPAKELKGTSVDIREALKAAARAQNLSESDRDGLLEIIDDLFDQDAAATIFRATDTNERGEPIVYLWEGGKRVPIRLGNDLIGRDIFEGMVAFGKGNSDFFTDTLAVGTQALRAGITKAPSYIVTNFLRDQIATWILSEHFTPFVTGTKGAISLARGDDATKRYTRFAGLMGGVDANLIDTAAGNRDVLTLRRKGFLSVPAKTGGLADVLLPKVAIERFQQFLRGMEVSEAATRIGHFKAAFDRAKADGLNDEEAAFEAAYAAHDVMDFSRRGAKMMQVSRIIAFLNAAIQGLDAHRRTAFTTERDTMTNYRELATPYLKAALGSPLSVAEKKALPNSARAWVKIATIGLVGVALAALYDDDDEYEEFNDYMRATHWFFKVNGVWVRYPKPFDLAWMSNAFEAAYERFKKENPRAQEQFVNSLWHTMLPPSEVNVMNLYYEWQTGKDTFRDRDIIPMQFSKLPPELQFNAYTSELGKMTGKLFDISPLQVDHVMSGLFGTLGRDALTLSDAVLPRVNQAVGGGLPGVSDTPRADKSFEDYAIISRLTRRAGRGSLSAEEFWNQMSQSGGEFVGAAEGYKELKRAGRPRDARDFVDGLPDEQKAFAYLEGEFTEKEQDLHPLNRARQVMSAASGIRKELALGRLFKQGTEPTQKNERKGIEPEEIVVSPSVAKIVNEVMEDITMREARNALVVIGHPGWAQKDIMRTEELLTELEAAAPEVAEEFRARLTKGNKKVYSFDAVRELWPTARERLLKDGRDADLTDIRADAAAKTAEERSKTLH